MMQQVLFIYNAAVHLHVSDYLREVFNDTASKEMYIYLNVCSGLSFLPRV